MNLFLNLRTLLFLAIAVAPFISYTGRNLEYEYSFIATLLLATLTLLCVMSTRLCRWLESSKYLKITGLFMIGLPVALAKTSKLCMCNTGEIFFWWGLQIIPSWFILWGIIETKKKISNTPYNMFFSSLLIATCFIWPLLELWFFPQKRSLSIIFGYIHGPIYDHLLHSNEVMIYRRTLHACIGLLLIFLPKMNRINQFYLTTILLALLGNMGLEFIPGQGHGNRALKQVLPNTKAGEGFTIHYSPQTSIEKVQSIYSQSQFHVDELSLLFPEAEHVEIYLYPNKRSKKLWFGGGGTDVADVVTPSIHIGSSSWPHPTLRHELVHAMAAKNAFFGLGFHPNMAFTEGLAVALAPTSRSLSLDQTVEALEQQKRLPSLKRIFSPLFWLEASHRSYPVAGSFIQFILENYSFRPIRLLYSGSRWKDLKSINQSFDDLTLSWLDQVGTQSNTPVSEDLYSESLFRYPGILSTRCPHSKASSQSSKVFPSWRSEIERPRSHQLNWLESLDPNNPKIQLEKHKLIAKKALQEKDRHQIKTMLDQLKSIKVRHLEDAYTILLTSDLYFWLDEKQKAEIQLAKLIQIDKEKKIGSALKRHLVLRTQFFKSPSSEQHKYFRLFLSGLKSWSQKNINLALWPDTYLYLRNQISIPPQQLEIAQQASIPQGLSNDMQLQWFKTLGVHFARQGRWKMSRFNFKKALEFTHEGSRKALEMYIREANYMLKKEA